MPAYARSEIVPRDEIGIYHCVSRCVRKAFLCGIDMETGRDYEHRKDWIRERLEELASIFAIEVCGYAIMSNHLHLVLRVRPDLTRDWSAQEVAWRWKTLCPPRDPQTGSPVEPVDCDLAMILNDQARVAVIRQRLGDLSWFMRFLSESIARRANREDQCTGRFWEGRFRSQALLDEAAVLACSIYVDLNPIRAAVAATPEESQYTSAYDRIRSLPPESLEVASNSGSSVESPMAEPVAAPLGNQVNRPDSWLCELTIQERPAESQNAISIADSEGAHADSGNAATSVSAAPAKPRLAARASNQGFLPIEIEKYLALLDWTGRQLRSDKRGMIPEHLDPILQRLGVIKDNWVETVRHFGRRFKTAAGRVESLTALAARRNKLWLKGQSEAVLAFG